MASGLLFFHFSGWLSHRLTLLSAYIGLAFVTFGQAIRKPTLEAFFAHQFEKVSMDEAQAEARSNIWWRFLTVVAIVLTMSYLDCDDNESRRIIITAVTMGATYILFLCGKNFYFRGSPSGSPISLVYHVCLAAFLKRHLDYPLSLCNYYREEDDLESGSFPLTNHLRWLNKAAIIECSPLNPEEQTNLWRLRSVKQVEHTKLLFGMLPMWMTFLVYGLIDSMGDSFFVAQGETLGREVPLLSLSVVESVARFAVSYLYEQLSKRLTIPHETKAQMVLGLFSLMASCYVASLVEAKRLYIVEENDLTDKPHKAVPMSIAYLYPQFFLLGVGEALAEGGLLSFFNDRVPESFRRYGPSLTDCVTGIGSLFGILLVHLTGYVHDTLNTSRLDKYFKVLTVFCGANLVIWCYVSSLYKYNEATTQANNQVQVRFKICSS